MITLARRITRRRPLFVSFLNLPDPPSTKKTQAAWIAMSSLSRYYPSAACSSSLPPLLAIPAGINHYRPFLTSFSTRCFTAASVTHPKIKLYQYHICPYCNIAKTLLWYSNLDYESVEVNPLTKMELKAWSGGYTKVPIALMDGRQVNGSEEILNAVLGLPHVREMLEKRWAGERSDGGDYMMTTQTMRQFRESENARKWTAFARNNLAMLLYPNICGSLGDSYRAFGYVKNVDSFSVLQKMYIRSLGALAMYLAAGKVKSKRNISDEKAALLEAIDKFEREGLQGGTLSYSSGLSHPDAGDLAMFGVLYSATGLDAHDVAIRSRRGPVAEWYRRVHRQVSGEEAEN